MSKNYYEILGIDKKDTSRITPVLIAQLNQLKQMSESGSLDDSKFKKLVCELIEAYNVLNDYRQKIVYDAILENPNLPREEAILKKHRERSILSIRMYDMDKTNPHVNIYKEMIEQTIMQITDQALMFDLSQLFEDPEFIQNLTPKRLTILLKAIIANKEKPEVALEIWSMAIQAGGIGNLTTDECYENVVRVVSTPSVNGLIRDISHQVWQITNKYIYGESVNETRNFQNMDLEVDKFLKQVIVDNKLDIELLNFTVKKKKGIFDFGRTK